MCGISKDDEIAIYILTVRFKHIEHMRRANKQRAIYYICYLEDGKHFKCFDDMILRRSKAHANPYMTCIICAQKKYNGY